MRRKLNAPPASRSSSLSGSVVQYMYQRPSDSWPCITVGSAQLSTVASPGTTGSSGFWYVPVPAAPTEAVMGTRSDAPSATATRRAIVRRRRDRVDLDGPVITTSPPPLPLSARHGRALVD